MKYREIPSLILLFLFCGLMTYGMFYNAYKFHTLEHGGWDAYHYLRMTEAPLDMDVAPSPNVFRQFGTCIAHLIWKAGIYHDTKINFAHPEIGQRIFFAGLASNYLAILLTMVVIGMTIRSGASATGPATIILGPLIFATAWGTVNFGLSPLAEAWTYFFMAISLLAYRKGYLKLFAGIILLSTTQKEIVSIAWTVFPGFMALLREGPERRRDLQVMLCSFGAFLLYYVVTNHLVEVKTFRDQLMPEQMPERWGRFVFSADTLQQTILLNSSLWTYVAVWLYASIKGLGNRVDKKSSYALMATLAAIYLIGMVSGIKTNTGRVTLILTPLWTVWITELLFRLSDNRSGKG